MGAASVEEALDMWDDLPVNATAEQTASWLTRAVRMILSRRSMSRELGIAYYRLIRALRTGRTTPAPWEPEIPDYVTISQLRREFRLLAEQTEQPAQEAGAEADSSDTGWDAGREDDDVEVEAELAKLLAEEEAEQRALEQEARTVLEAVGPNRLDGKLSVIDKGESVQDVDQAREAARQQAGIATAGHASRMVKDGARSYVHQAAQADPRAIGFVRVTDGDPCAFCAMLASRGLVLYSSKRAATLTEDGDKYHPNCNCHAEPVFSADHYKTSPLFAANRQYEEAWKQIVDKGSEAHLDNPELDQDAINVWRRYIERQRRAARSRGQTTETAQEASA